MSRLQLMRSQDSVTSLSPIASNYEVELVREEFADLGEGGFLLDMDNDTGIGTLTIDHYQKRNSFSGRMMVQLDEILCRLENWKEGKIILIRGSNGFFCSGADLSTISSLGFETEVGKKMNILMQDNLSRIQNLPQITVALIEGKAIGGGAEVCTACDFRIMEERAEIGFVQIRMGITTGWGGGSRLVQMLGPCKALDIMATGRRLSARQAATMGLCNHIVRMETATDLDGVTNFLDPFLVGGSRPLQAAKKIVNSAKWLPIHQALEEEREIFTSVWGGPDHKAAMGNNVKHK